MTMTSPEVITSPANRWVKLCVALAESSKARREHGLVLLEGIHLCQSLLASRSGRAIAEPDSNEVLLISPDAMQQPEIAVIVREWRGQHAVLDAKLFKLFSSIKNGPLVALLAKPSTSSFASLTQKIGGTLDVVYLYGVQDPGNVGTIIRTAAATGSKTIVCAPGTVSSWSPKVLRAAMGAHFSIQIIEDIDWQQMQRFCEANGLQIRATAAHAKQSVFQSDLTASSCWVLGSEGQGLPFAQMGIEPSSDCLVSIPQQSVESLNVAVAATVCLYEQWRQRHAVSDSR